MSGWMDGWMDVVNFFLNCYSDNFCLILTKVGLHDLCANEK